MLVNSVFLKSQKIFILTFLSLKLNYNQVFRFNTFRFIYTVLIILDRKRLESCINLCFPRRKQHPVNLLARIPIRNKFPNALDGVKIWMRSLPVFAMSPLRFVHPAHFHVTEEQVSLSSG